MIDLDNSDILISFKATKYPTHVFFFLLFFFNLLWDLCKKRVIVENGYNENVLYRFASAGDFL